jgi:cystathionine beta-lyase/cystathionine gamma-synthase
MTTPVYRTTGFTFDTAEQMAETAAGHGERFLYSRYDNPSLHEAEQKLAALEGAGAGADVGAVVFSSGMAAVTAALMAGLSAGDHFIAQAELYGGTTGLIRRVLRRFGVDVTYVEAAALGGPGLDQRLDSAASPATRAVYLETPANPTLRIVDIEAVARTARARGWRLLVDNTFASPINQRPLALGADVVIHSATKYLAGHSDLTAGFVVTQGEMLDKARELRIDLGGCLDASVAWLLARSMKTLALRIAAQNDNAMAVAGCLERHPKVARVHYPGLASHPGHETARRQMSGFGGMVSFEMADEQVAPRVIAALRLIRLAPTLGGVETTASVPALSSHVKLTPDERRAAGIGDGLIRLSVGVEDTADIIEDLEQALG